MPISPEVLKDAQILSYYKGKIALITGAGGSIGSALCKRLIQEGVAELRMISLTENALYQLTKQLQPAAEEAGAKLVGFLGSVNDYDMMSEALRGVDVVIHAAAHKHVPLCEENPVEAIRNNVFGTERVAILAGKHGVQDFVFISTDKAVRPTSVMGATKRLAELCVHDVAKRSKDTRYRVVRFGNVYGSAGSVIPLWIEQIKAGGPVTITDPEATRYFMEIRDAVALVLTVPPLPNGEVGPYVFNMGKPHCMMDILARLMANELPLGRVAPEVKVIGLRPGEKLHEELDYGGERVATDCVDISLVRERVKTPSFKDLMALSGCVDRRQTAEAKAQLFGMVSA